MKQITFTLFLLFCVTIVFGQPKDLVTAINDYARNNNFNGTILVTQNNQQLYHQSFGYANRSYDIKSTNETRYKIASITKAFTAVLILQLYEQHKLALDQPIKNYLPDYTGEGADKVTIHHLLTHSSGIENCEKNGLEIYERPQSTDTIVKKYCSGKLENEVGSNFNYNNGDYIILGKIIEAIYKKPYQQVLQEKILTPLKMQNTNLLFQASIIKDLASTYLWNDSTKVFENDPSFYIENYFSAGALYSTTTDLSLFADALFGKKLIQESTLNLMLTSYPRFWYTAYSVWVTNQKINNQQCRVVERYGGIYGANLLFAHYMEQNINIIIFSNTNATDLGKLKEEISKTLIR